MREPINILVIEDNPADYLLTERHLAARGVAATCTRVESLERIEETLKERKWDLIISDYGFPKFDFMDGFSFITREAPGTPVILVSGKVGEERAVELLKSGVRDFILKDNLARLVPAIERVLNESAERKARLAAEEGFKESENRFTGIFEHAPIAIGVGESRSGVMREVNSAWLRLFGYRREEVVGRTVNELGLYPNVDERAGVVATIRAEGRLINRPVQLRHKSGAIMDALYSAELISLGGLSCLQVMLTDVSEQKRAEQALLESSQFNQQIVASAQVGIIVYGKDLRYQVWNPYMERLLGIPAGQVLGRHPLEVFPFLLETGVMGLVEKALRGEETEPLEMSFQITQSGCSGCAEQTRAPLRNAKGEIIGVIGMVRDITEQRRLEAQLRQSQKMEAIGQLAGGGAHDFNNILQVIMGYSNLLLLDDRKEAREGEVEQILMAAEKAAQLTHGLLAFSRKQAILPKLEDLNGLVRRVKQFLKRIIGEDIQLKAVFGAENLPVVVDGGQIEQVLVNLATNARDAMPRGGMLTLETGVVEAELPIEHFFGRGEPGRYACITVSDTGFGMDEATLPRIFEPFFTTKEVGKGTGLGMAIVFGTIKQHGGFICASSEVGRGTTFRIHLPLADAAQGEQDVRRAKTLPGKGTETILLAEDDAHVRTLMVTVLTRFGYQVIQAEDGDEAVEKFLANRERIRLILMDVIMPRKNGKAAYEEICSVQGDARVLFLSGYTADFITERGLSEEGLDLIIKPIQPLDLLRKVRNMLDR